MIRRRVSQRIQNWACKLIVWSHLMSQIYNSWRVKLHVCMGTREFKLGIRPYPTYPFTKYDSSQLHYYYNNLWRRNVQGLVKSSLYVTLIPLRGHLRWWWCCNEQVSHKERIYDWHWFNYWFDVTNAGLSCDMHAILTRGWRRKYYCKSGVIQTKGELNT